MKMSDKLEWQPGERDALNENVTLSLRGNQESVTHYMKMSLIEFCVSTSLKLFCES